MCVWYGQYDGRQKCDAIYIASSILKMFIAQCALHIYKWRKKIKLKKNVLTTCWSKRFMVIVYLAPLDCHFITTSSTQMEFKLCDQSKSIRLDLSLINRRKFDKELDMNIFMKFFSPFFFCSGDSNWLLDFCAHNAQITKPKVATSLKNRCFRWILSLLSTSGQASGFQKGVLN